MNLFNDECLCCNLAGERLYGKPAISHGALEKAFELYPDVKIVVYAELYGFPGRVDLIKKICEKHGALLIEDAAEAMGAIVDGKQCGSYGSELQSSSLIRNIRLKAYLQKVRN